VIWTKIGECIDDKKSLVLYFDGCTVSGDRNARVSMWA